MRNLKEIARNNTYLQFLFIPFSLAYLGIFLILICLCAIGLIASIVAFFLHILEIQSIFTKYEILYSLKWWYYPIISFLFYILGKALYWVMKLPFGDLD